MMFQWVCVLSEYKIISLKNNLKLLITFGFVRFRYSTPVCVRVNYGKMTLVRFCYAGF